MTCQYSEGFRWLKSHPKPRVGKLKRDKYLARNVLISTFFRGSKSIKNRYRFCTISLVGLEEEIIDKGNPIGWLCNFGYNRTGFLPWECHRHPTEQLLDEVEHDIMNYQNRGLCYLPKPKAEADNTDTRF